MTEVRFGLPGDVLARLEKVAERQGSTAEAVAVRILARELPDVLAAVTHRAFAETLDGDPLPVLSAGLREGPP